MLTSQQPVRYSRFFEREAVSLARAGYAVTLVGLGPGPEDVVEQGVRLVSVPARPGLAKRQALRVIGRLAEESGAGVFHCFDPWTLNIGLRVARGTGAAVIYDSTELFPAVYRDRQDWPLPLRLAAAARVRRIEARAARDCAVIIETNRTRARRFSRLGRDPVLVPNYPPLEHLAGPAATREPVIAYTGLISYQRGFDRLLGAFARVAPDLPGARLLVVGGFDPRSDIRQRSGQLAAGAGLAGRVEFTGWLGYRELLGRLGSCLGGAILLQPERENDYTGQPNKLFEFMGAGLAVIASGFPEMAGIVARHGCGRTVDPTSVEEIAGALRAVLADPDAAARSGDRGRAAVLERYHWGRAEANLLAAYREAGC